MKTQLKKSAVILMLAGLTLSFPSMSASWMEDFYTGAGATVNITNAGVYQTPGSTVYSGGGVTMRIPGKNLQPVAFTPPGLKAGCGGIDFWAGSFSFINKDAFVQFLRNIGQNAVGYFFQLALESISPEIAGVLKDLNKLAQDMNKFNMNSCEASKTFVETMDKQFSIRKKIGDATNFGTADGSSSDYMASVSNFRTDVDSAISKIDEFFNNNGGNKDVNNNPVIPTSTYNVLYKALAPVMIADSAGRNLDNAGFTEDEIGLIISLTGSTIVRVISGTKDGKGGTQVTEFMPPIITDLKTFMGDGTDTFSFKIYDCVGSPGSVDNKAISAIGTIGPANGEGCTSLSVLGNALKKDYSGKGFKKIVADAMQEMSDNMKDRNPQTPLTMKIAVMSSLPIYQILKTAHEAQFHAGLGFSAGPVNPDDLVAQLSDTVAYEIATYYLEYMLKESKKAMSASHTSGNAEVEDMENIQNRMQEMINEAREERRKLNQQVTNNTQVMTWINSLQVATAQSLGDRYMQNMQFNKVH